MRRPYRVDPGPIAFQGAPGAYSEQAARLLFGAAPELVPMGGFDQVADAVARGAVAAGVLPLSNSAVGEVEASRAAIDRWGLVAVEEVTMRIRHCILGAPGATLEGVAEVLSHPVALAQCVRFLTTAEIRASPFFDTGGAAEEVARRGDPTVAAIAGREAAERYGLPILAAGVEDRVDNCTRFACVIRGVDGPGPGD